MRFFFNNNIVYMYQVNLNKIAFLYDFILFK